MTTVKVASGVVFAVLSIMMSAAALADPAFVNGSFEVDSTSGFESSCITGLTGWAVHCTSAPPYLINNGTFGNTPFGQQFVAIGGIEDGATSWIEQTVSGFIPGDTYVLTWAQSSEFTSSDELNVSFISGSSTASQTFTTPPYPGGRSFWFTWTNESMSFVADAASVTFHFQGVPGSGSYEVGVDNFQISGASSTVPEPSSIVLLGTVLLAAGLSLRRSVPKS